MQITIDGNSMTGRYRVTCTCGQWWSGQAEEFQNVPYVPCLPIAESMAHMRLEHHGAALEVLFTIRFRAWLLSYWEQATHRQAVALQRATA